jgi:hypothetical protein
MLSCKGCVKTHWFVVLHSLNVAQSPSKWEAGLLQTPRLLWDLGVLRVVEPCNHAKMNKNIVDPTSYALVMVLRLWVYDKRIQG